MRRLVDLGHTLWNEVGVFAVGLMWSSMDAEQHLLGQSNIIQYIFQQTDFALV